MKKLKIAIVSPYPPSKGTLNEYAFHMINNMKNNKDIEEITIISDVLPSGKEFIPEEGSVKINFKQVWKFNKLTNPLLIAKAVREIKPDAVLYNLQFLSFGDKKIPATLGLLTPLITRLFGFPSVVLLHNIIETVDYSSAGITNNPIMKWIYNSVGTILTKAVLSANMVTVTMAKYVEILEKKYKAKNVALVPHGSFELPEIPSFVVKPNARKQVMTFGKFGTYKKVEEMIEAVEIVRRRTGEELEIVIAGTDNPNVKGYLEGVKEKYKHVPNIKFTGYVEEEDVPKIFNDCTVAVFPYTSTTGSSGVLHQAGSYGKPVVMPSIGDLKELIEEEGYEGAFFKPNDIEGMADAIEKLILDPNERERIGRKNYAAAVGLPMEDIVEWYKMHFSKLIKPSNSKKKMAKKPIAKKSRLEKTPQLVVVHNTVK